ncbi:Ubiquitinyl hydrolase 1, partial [Caligus rogercresseyi]
ESTKQLTMKKLPIVASFHLKRFEHSSRFHKKISTRIAFPEILDMSPFVSHIRNNSASPVNSGSYTYTLFAVINHTGNIEAGHYTSFVRQHRIDGIAAMIIKSYPLTSATYSE